MKTIALIALLLVSWLAASLAQGNPGSASGIVFEQPPNYSGGLISDGVSHAWADDIELPQTTTVRSILWWGGGADPTTTENFVVRLYSNDSTPWMSPPGGGPGELLPGFAIGSITAAADPAGNPQAPAFLYSAVLQQPFVFEGGVRYWLSLGKSPLGWGWGASDVSSSPGAVSRSEVGAWTAWPTANAAFALSLDVPEPRTIHLLSFAAAVWVVWLRRRANKTGAGNGAMALSFHVGRRGRAVPDLWR